MDVSQISDLRKSIERNAERQDDRMVRQIDAGETANQVDAEIDVLVIGERKQIGGDRDRERRRSPGPLRLNGDHVTHGVIERHRDKNHWQERYLLIRAKYQGDTGKP